MPNTWRAPAAIVAGSLGILASWYVVLYGGPHTNIEVADLWLGETDTQRAAFHGTIANRGVNGDRLVRIASNLANKVAIFDHEGREIENLRIRADAELVFGGGSLRMEAIGLQRPIKANESFPLLLVFERTGKVWVNAQVRAMRNVGWE
jgi:copper(I)-binding protein